MNDNTDAQEEKPYEDLGRRLLLVLVDAKYPLAHVLTALDGAKMRVLCAAMIDVDQIIDLMRLRAVPEKILRKFAEDALEEYRRYATPEEDKAGE